MPLLDEIVRKLLLEDGESDWLDGGKQLDTQSAEEDPAVTNLNNPSKPPDQSVVEEDDTLNFMPGDTP